MAVIKPIDWIIIVAYFGIILGLAWWVMRQKQKTSTD
jgi:SSS family solute:Na+ symporter